MVSANRLEQFGNYNR